MTVRGFTHDGMIAHHVVHCERGVPHDLGFAGSTYGPIPYWKDVAKGDKDDPDEESNFALLDVDKMRTYNLDDCQTTKYAHVGLSEEIDELHLRHVYEHDMRKNHVVRRMMQRGVLIDQSARAQRKLQNEQDIRAIEEDLRDLLGSSFNPNSDHQLRDLLFNQIGFKPTSYTAKKHQGKVDFDALISFQEACALSDPIRTLFDLLISRNKYETIVSNFLGGRSDAKERKRSRKNEFTLDHAGAVHTRFSLHITPSGRLSSAAPNLQNIPDSLRNLFIARPGYVFLSRDYSQVELRIYAYGSGDDVLIAVFERRDGTKLDRDPHTQSAVSLFRVPAGQVTKEQRDFIKIFHYGGLLYAGTASTIRAQAIREVLKRKFETRDYTLTVPTPSINEIEYLQQQWFLGHPKAALFNARIEDRVAKESVAETLILGRKRFFIIPLHEAKRAARSHVVSGTAADVIDLAMLSLDACFLDSYDGEGLALQLHDELLMEVRKDRVKEWSARSKEIMERPVVINGRTIVLPTEAKVGPNWGEMETVD